MTEEKIEKNNSPLVSEFLKLCSSTPLLLPLLIVQQIIQALIIDLLIYSLLLIDVEVPWFCEDRPFQLHAIINAAGSLYMNEVELTHLETRLS